MASRAPLVTVLGASGFLGSAVTRELAGHPIRLRAVARRAAVVPAVVPDDAVADLDVREADLVTADLADLVAGADTVIHLVTHNDGGSWRVAEGDRRAERVNVGVVRDLVAALRTNRRSGPPPAVVFAGSTSTNDPATPYDRQKLAAERALEAATAEGVLRATTLRLSTVFGHAPGTAVVDRGFVVTMSRRALAGEPLTMWGDGSMGRDLVHVTDVVHAFLAAIDHPDALSGRHWPIGSGRSIPIRDLLTMIADTVSVHTGRTPVPVLSVPPPEHATAADLRTVDADPSVFETVTGWRPTVPLGEALRHTVAALADSQTTPSGKDSVRQRGRRART
jgi:nucleoside-diphosphate-sugar epimerase